MIEFVTLRCIVCDAEVVAQADVTPPEPPTCIEHYFGDDPTQPWEADVE